MALIGEMKYLTIGGNTYSIPEPELPIASSSTLGGIKVGSGLTIDSSTGVLTATGTSITIDTAMSDSSTNTVQNKVIKSYVDTNIPTKVSDLQNDSGFTTNTGTVTSVRVQASSPLSSSTSTAQSTSLNTTISFSNQNKNLVLAGPSSGSSAAAPSFRSLVADDIPDLSGIYLTSFTETDPVFSASAAAGITATDITNWDNKVSDDHKWNDVTLNKSASSGYSGYVPFLASTSETTANLRAMSDSPSSGRIAVYNSGNYLISTTPGASDNSTKVATTAWVTGKGYLTSYTETDPTVPSWAKASTKPSYTASEVGAVATSAVGAASGVAPLNASSKIDSTYLPSYVDDIIEGYYYNSKFWEEAAHTTEITGEAGKIYVDLSTNKTYRYSGTGYVEVSSGSLVTITRNLTSGTKSATINVDGTDYDIYSVTNTDQSVAQARSTSNDSYAVLLRSQTGATDSTDGTKYSSNFTVQPSTGDITVGKINNRTIAEASEKSVDSSISSGSSSTNLPTSAAVASFVEGKGYLTSYTETDPVFSASAAAGISSTDINNWNAKGSVSSVGLTNATNGGLTISGSPVTSSGSITVGHTNVLTSAQTTQAVYPIKIDKNGHISAYGSAVSIPSKTSDLTNDSGFITDAGVTSFNGDTGAITYTAPVTSVNGNTGAVTTTDQNVTQTAVDISTIAEHRLLLSNSTNDTTETNGVFKAGKLTYSPFYHRLTLYPGTSDSGKLRIYYRDGFYFNLEPYGYSGDSSNYNAIVAFTSGNGKDVVLRGIGTPTFNNAATNKLYVDSAVTTQATIDNTGLITYKNSRNTSLYTVQLPLFDGGSGASDLPFLPLAGGSLTGNLSVGGTTTSTGLITGNGGISTTTLTASGNTTVGGNLSVSGTTTSTKLLTANGGISTTTLTTSGNTVVGGTLGVTGATTLDSTLGVTGATTLDSTLDVTGTTTVENVTVNGVFDVTKRRCYSAQLDAGWHRVLRFYYGASSATGEAYARGAIGSEIVLHITRRRTTYGEENHDIKILCTYDGIKFVDETSASASGYQAIDKVRYNCSGSYGYVDIHLTSTVAHVTVACEVYCEPDYQPRYTAASLEAVADSQSGETILTEYALNANGAGDITYNGDVTVGGVLDVAQRRCYAVLSSAGWYRVMKLTGSNIYEAEGAGGFIVDFNITRNVDTANNEAHKISLMATWNNIKFINEQSVSNTLGITKIRTTNNGSNLYVDVYYGLSTQNTVTVAFNVTCRGGDESKFNSQPLTSVADSPSSETVLTEYRFAENTGVPVSFSPTTGSAYRACWYARIGNVCYLHVDMKELTPSTNTQIFTLPVGYRPLYPTAIQGQGQESYGALASCIVQTDGSISIYSQDHYAVIDGNFICKVQ